MLRPGRPSCGGFSLVEVLVALAILVAGAMALAQLSVLAASANASARDMTYATVLAAQKLEELRTLVSPAGGSHVEHVDRLGDVAVPGVAAFVRRWSIAPVAADSTGSLVVIEVVVVPRAGAGETRLVTVRALERP